MMKESWIRRFDLTRQLERALRANPVVALIGPRQCGKTTLARALAADRRSAYFDLEDPLDLERLAQPKLALGEAHTTVKRHLDERRDGPESGDSIITFRYPAPRRTRRSP